MVCAVEATQVRQGQISMREFIRALGRSNEYRRQFYGRFSNSRVVELAFRHFLGRGVSSIEEFRRYFAIVSEQGLNGLVDCLVNGMEYARVFGEETVPYLRDLGEEAQESAGWGSNRKLFRFSAPFEGAPQYITLYASYRQPLPDQHPYGGGNDPIGRHLRSHLPLRHRFGGHPPRAVQLRQPPHPDRQRDGPAGPMDSKQFRKAVPRRVGPTVKTLGRSPPVAVPSPAVAANPACGVRSRAPRLSSRAVYVQVLGTIGYAGERNTVEEIKLENGDISLREFARQLARSKAFRRRYWSGLYITKAIEVMHRRILGRPTFGRWEINAYFDTAARKGFYGVVDAMLESREYNDCFGEDTVPYERFITPADRNARRVPALRRPLDTAAVADLTPVQRPQVSTPRPLRTVGDLVPRNLPGWPRLVRGSWTATVSGADQGRGPGPPSSAASSSVRSLPAPSRSWVWTPPATQSAGVSRPASRRAASASGRAVPLLSHRSAGCNGRRRSGMASRPQMPGNPVPPWSRRCGLPLPRALPVAAASTGPFSFQPFPAKSSCGKRSRSPIGNCSIGCPSPRSGCGMPNPSYEMAS